jgi:hypothetical protein
MTRLLRCVDCGTFWLEVIVSLCAWSYKYEQIDIYIVTIRYGVHKPTPLLSELHSHDRSIDQASRLRTCTIVIVISSNMFITCFNFCCSDL